MDIPAALQGLIMMGLVKATDDLKEIVAVGRSGGAALPNFLLIP